jgi:large subunit ribosomal protein L10
MNRTEKEQLVSDLKTKLESATALYYTDFTGLNVKRMTDLRRKLRKANVEYVVIKNTLALRAVNESGLIGERLRGPTGLVVAKDPIAAAKVITDFAKENDQKPTVKCSPSSARACSRRWPDSSARSAASCTCSRARSKVCARSARAPERDKSVSRPTAGSQ